MKNTIKCSKCDYETEWEEMFYGKNANMINWENGTDFEYKCECCGHKFVVTTLIEYNFISSEIEEE